MTTTTLSITSADRNVEKISIPMTKGSMTQVVALPHSHFDLQIPLSSGMKKRLKKADNNLLIEVDGELVVEVIDFYRVEGASVHAEGWAYAAQDGLILSSNELVATSEAMAVEESANMTAVTPLGMIAAAGIGVLAAVGSGASATPASGSIISGTVLLGPIVTGAKLSIQLFDAQGQLLAEAFVNVTTGKYTATIGNYKGAVVAKLVDADNGADYRNEANGLTQDASDGLLAIGWVSANATLTLNVTPLTHIAALLAGLSDANPNTPGAAPIGTVGLQQTTVNSANKNVATAFGLAGLDVSTDTPLASIDADNSLSQSSNTYGKVLAAFSGTEGMAQKNTLAMAREFTDQINGTELSQAGKATLKAGVQYAENHNAATLGSSLSSSGVFWNETPSAVSLQNVTRALTENSDMASRLKLADIVITDDALGTNTITLNGADATYFEVLALNGTSGLYLKANTSLDYEVKSEYAVTVNVIDNSVAGSRAVATSFAVEVIDQNEAPTAIVLQNVTRTLAENTIITSSLKVADLAITDDALGMNSITLSGTDAANFEVITTNGTSALYLKANTSLDYEVKPGYAVTVNVIDSTVQNSLGIGVSYNLSVTNVNDAPTAVLFNNIVDTVSESLGISSRIKVADISITDDDLGTNNISLSGIDADKFEVVGNALYFKAGVALDYETQPEFTVTLSVLDSSLVGSSALTNTFHLNVLDVAETVSSAVTQISITQATGIQAGVLDAGDIVTIEVEMSQAVALTGGGPTLAMNIGGHVVQTSYSGISTDGKILSFAYTLPEGFVDANGISFDANSLGLTTGATMTTVWNSVPVNLSSVAVADNASYKVAPSIKGVYNWLDDSYSHTVGAGLLYEDLTDPTFSSMPSIDGMVGANETIQLSWGLNNTRTVTANANGLWEYYLTQADITTMDIGTEVISASFTQGADTVTNTYSVNINAQAQVTLRAAESGYGSAYVDALITGNSGWKYPTITYSFASVANGSIAEWTAAEMQSFRDATQLYANVANLRFVEGVFDSNAAYSTNMNLYKYSADQMVGGVNAGAEFYLPIDYGYDGYYFGITKAPNYPLEGHFNVSEWSAPKNGTYSQYATIHELGHGLGLSHPFDGNTRFPGVADKVYQDLGTNDLDTGMWTIMAYNFGWPEQTYRAEPSLNNEMYGFAMTPMTFDVAAIQQMYGANTTFKTGNDTYLIPTVTGPGEGWVCIWDAGGIDTISNAGSNSACSINLNAYPKEGGLPSSTFVSYATGFPAGFTIADGVTIENAIGGNGADILIGNTVSNSLTGGSGADQFVFSTALNSSNIDTLMDFSATQGDQIALSQVMFSALAGLTNLTNNFIKGAGVTVSADANDYLIYNTTNGALYYDRDGSASVYAAVEFAILQTKPTDITASQFVVI